MTKSIDRRMFIQFAAAGAAGYFMQPLSLRAQSADIAPNVFNSARYVIFVLLPGAPSQIDTFDLHVGPWTPANFAPTTINGADWPSGLLPKLGEQFSLNRFSICRSFQSTALVHSLLQTWAQIARNPASAVGKIAPNIGSVVALELAPQLRSDQKLPVFVSLNGGSTVAGQGYFPGRFAPFDVTPNANGLANLANADGQTLFNLRFSTLQAIENDIRSNSMYGVPFDEMGDFYAAANRMMYDPAVTAAFRFSTSEQQKYGNTGFGNACITAKNLIQADLGTRFIEIVHGGWDNHQNIYANNAGIYPPARALDAGLGNLIADLAATPGSGGRTRLDETLIVAKGEFGRTIGRLTNQQGRDHYFVHSAIFAGGGVRGGRVLGKTTTDGAFIEDTGWSQGRPMLHEDTAATIYSALGINYRTVRRDDPLGRGFEYVSAATDYPGEPIAELFT